MEHELEKNLEASAIDDKKDKNEPTNEEYEDAKVDQEITEPDVEGNESQTEEEKKTLDFSAQGLTMLPMTLFTRKDVVFLNISSNNLRNLPPEISQLALLKRLDVSRNPLRVNNVNDLSSLPLEMAEMSQLEEIVLAECNLSFIPATIWHMYHLLKLDISRNRLSSLPPDIGGMSKLRCLNAQDTGISTLPPEIVCCEKLESLLLYGNVIINLPDTLRELKKLQVLTINYSHFCADIDESMENLLSKGKIMSEHIPPVVFQIPKLKMLSLDNCKLNTLPSEINEFLVEINFSSNFFSEVPQAVCSLQKIVIIDLNNNQISHIPDVFSHLQSLREFSCRNNRLKALSASLCKLTLLKKLDVGNNEIRDISPDIGKLIALEKLTLDHNMIEYLPEQVCQMTSLNTLDLTGNQIRSLPSKLRFLHNLCPAHSYEGLFKTGLWLHKNPITAPPPTYWRCTQIDRIWKSLKKLEIQSIQNLQPIRVVVLGNTGCGKQSFVNSLLTGKPSNDNNQRLFEKDESFYSCKKWITGNKIEFRIFNFNCYPVFEKLLCHFIDKFCLFIIVFDISEYENEGFDHQIGRWLKTLQVYAPRSTVKLVGVKLDKYIEEELIELAALEAENDDNDSENNAAPLKVPSYVSEEKTSEEIFVEEEELVEKPSVQELKQCVKNKISDKEQNFISLIKEDMEGFISQYNSLASQWRSNAIFDTSSVAFDMEFEMDGKVTMISTSSVMNGLEEFVEEMELLAINSKSFGKHHTAVPKTWTILIDNIKKYKQDHKCYIKYSYVEELALSIGISDSVLENTLMHFHRCGEIFWLHRHPLLRGYVFHQISRLNSLLSTVIRINFDSYLDYNLNPIFRCAAGLSENQFVECRDIFCKYGELSPALLKCLSFYINPSKRELKHIKKLLALFEVAILLPTPQLQRGLYLYNQPILILPQFASELIPQDYYQSIKAIASRLEKSKYEFPQGRPFNLFETLSVRLHPLVEYREDWNGLVFAKTTCSQVILEESSIEDTGKYVISLTVFHLEQEEDSVNLIEWFSQQVKFYNESVPGLIVCSI